MKPPLITETAFECPHCGAYTTQYWFDVYANRCEKNSTPLSKKKLTEMIEDKGMPEDAREICTELCAQLESGLVLFKENNEIKHFAKSVNNLHLSQCYNCDKIAVWVNSTLFFPKEKEGMKPNQDLPEDIIRDFEEARSIIKESPRGAAALLRLCVQKLCKHLGGKGKDLNEDIANLVAQGLNPLIQKSLDIVRVIGNNAVHPGVIDLNDDPGVAIRLLGLINAVADQMISHPKNVDELYGELPQRQLEEIGKRDKN